MPRKRLTIKENSKALCNNCKRFNPKPKYPYSHPCAIHSKVPTVYCKTQINIKPNAPIAQKTNTPRVIDVRKAIEKVKIKKYRIFLKTLYICGAARAAEITGKRPNSERGLPLYGVSGDDVWLDEATPPDPRWTDQLEMLVAIQQGTASIDELIRRAKEKTPIAVFKIPIAKTKPMQGEEIPCRLVALPLDPKYESWTREIYEYFQKRKGRKVFPFSRQDVLDYVSRKDPIFKGFYYQIKRYVYLDSKDKKLSRAQLELIEPGLSRELQERKPNIFGVKCKIIGDYEYRINQSGEICQRLMFKVLGHHKPFKLHALRHVRTDELIKDYGFDGMDLSAYVGWTLSGLQAGRTDLPKQAFNYADIRQCWERYIQKLLVEPKHEDSLMADVIQPVA